MLLTGIARQIEAQGRARARRYEAEYLANVFGLDYELPVLAGQGATEPARRGRKVRSKDTSGAEGEAGKRVCEVRLKRWMPLFDDIVSAVGEATRVTPAEMHGRSRLQRIAYARQLAMYLMRQITRASYPRIGDFFGRGHATVIYACVSMRARLPFDVEGRRALDKIVAIFGDRRRELQNRESAHQRSRRRSERFKLMPLLFPSF
jgi:DnaA-like protein